MKCYIVIPAYNEEAFIGKTLDSLITQTVLPKKVVVVNDNSTDKTAEIVTKYTTKHPWISLVNTSSKKEHIPGAKIVSAFYQGYEILDEDYDVICKFDADLIFPNNYLEILTKHFNNNDKLGMAAGFCYIEKNGAWQLENLTRKDHIRGALKAYRKACFKTIGGLKNAMGWDTVDELLAQYYGWELTTDESLVVKHLKPTGSNYAKASKYLQGEALYKMRYGFILTFITALKLAYKKGSFTLFKAYLAGYFKAKKEKVEFLVTKEQGKFIRKLRWTGILNKFFLILIF